MGGGGGGGGGLQRSAFPQRPHNNDTNIILGPGSYESLIIIAHSSVEYTWFGQSEIFTTEGR